MKYLEKILNKLEEIRNSIDNITIKEKLNNKLTIEQLNYIKDEMQNYINLSNCDERLLLLFKAFENSLFKSNDFNKYFNRRVESKRQELIERGQVAVDNEEKLKLKHQIEILAQIQFL